VISSLSMLLRGPACSRALLLCAVFFFLSFAHYGISSWIADLFSKVHFTNPYATSIFYTFATVPGLGFAIFTLDRFGRRAVTGGAMFAACAAALLFAFDTGERMFIMVCAALFNASAACAWNGIDVFSSELLPSRIRGTGLGLCTACGRVGSILANVFNSNVLARQQSDEQNVALVLISAGIAMTLGAVCVLRLPETLTR